MGNSVFSVSQSLTGEGSMKKIDRMREKVTILPTSMYLSKMHDAGWSLVALEWEREVESTAAPQPQEASGASEEIPFGLRISSDCHHLEDDPLEMQTLKFLAEMIFQEYGRGPEHPGVPHTRRPPLERRDRLPAYPPPDRCRTAHPLRRGMGVAQETIDTRRLELLTNTLSR